MVGNCPKRVNKLTSPVPPEVLIDKLVAPAGTAIENNLLDAEAPERLATDTPFCKAVTEPPLDDVLKIAPTLIELVPATTVQLPTPVQAPLQPAKVLPVAGVAEIVTLLVDEKLAEATPQEVPQLIPIGLLLSVPAPVPALVTVISRVAGTDAKLAVTDLAAVIPTVQVLVDPEQAPPQLAKVLPEVGVAVKITLVPPG